MDNLTAVVALLTPYGLELAAAAALLDANGMMVVLRAPDLSSLVRLCDDVRPDILVAPVDAETAPIVREVTRRHARLCTIAVVEDDRDSTIRHAFDTGASACVVASGSAADLRDDLLAALAYCL